MLYCQLALVNCITLNQLAILFAVCYKVNTTWLFAVCCAFYIRLHFIGLLLCKCAMLHKIITVWQLCVAYCNCNSICAYCVLLLHFGSRCLTYKQYNALSPKCQLRNNPTAYIVISAALITIKFHSLMRILQIKYSVPPTTNSSLL